MSLTGLMPTVNLGLGDDDEQARKFLGLRPATLGATPPTLPGKSYGVPTEPDIRPSEPVGLIPDASAQLGPRRPSPAADAYEQLREQGQPQLHGIKKVFDVLGQGFAPRIEQAVPGSPGYYRRELGQAEKAAEEESLLGERQSTDQYRKWEMTKPQTVESGGRAYERGTQGWQPIGEAGQEKPDNPEQQFIDDFLQRNPGKNIQDAVKAYAEATQKPEKPQAQSEEERFVSEYLRDNRLPDTASNRLAAHRAWSIKPEGTGTTDARMDRGYQFSANQISTLSKPVEDASQRLGRLRDTLAQGSPQADALVAPELLTVMAGGQGSGLRMNEAEIARIVGGRSNWESLKASINKWRTDPSTANSITPPQREQIHALVDTVHSKLLAKQQLIDEAQQALIDAPDVNAQRRIVADLRKRITEIGAGQGGGAPQGGTITMRAPNGQTKQVPADQVDHFKSLGATVVSQ